MSVIKINNITKIYKQNKIETRALNNVNLEINNKELTVFYGPSGSGKTTLLNIIGSLDSPSSGSLEINGEDITKMSSTKLSKFRLDNMGFVFQSYNLFPVLTAIENVGIGLELKGLSKDEVQERSLKALEDVGLKDFYKRKPKELSGGQQQRVAVARALVGKPSLILGDEPTANLDSKNSESLIETLKEMKEKYNTTVILSSHDEMVIKKAERAVMLKDGEIVS